MELSQSFPSSVTLAIFQVLSNHKWLVVTVLDSADYAFPALPKGLMGRVDPDQRLANFLLKGPIVIISGFAGHLKSVSTPPLCHCSVKQP